MEPDSDWNALSPSEKANSLVKQAGQASKDGQDQLAWSCYTRALNLYEGLNDRPNTLRMLIRISYLSGWADFGDGLDMFSRRRNLSKIAMPLARDLGDKALLASALVAFAAGESREIAKPMLEESVALAEECGDKSALAWAKTRLAGTYSLTGADKKNRGTLNKEALALYEEIDDKSGIAGLLFSMSIGATRPEKRALLERALVLQRELGAKKRCYEALSLLQSYCNDDEMDLRETYLIEALEICRQINSPIWLASCLDNLAEIARKRGDNARAEALEAESKSVYEPPPADPEADEAFKQALTSGSMNKIERAFKRVFKGR